ncbi:hypothetical protein SteCoe_34076 [Stentor coeruleus]|uniref:Uncharacterized protein n=1 Tax=Stentor coeruleus TaxID=5963 RepID=A0A1R2AVA4_9CILI|nr:hypothetical protein SteCoe_34076 [Stentor coeruleus]
MDNKLIHGSVLLVFVLFTAYWLCIKKPSSKLHKHITITLVVKVFFSGFVFIEEFIVVFEIIVLRIFLSHLYLTCLYHAFMQIGQGWFLSMNSSIWPNFICICLVNLSLLGYSFDTNTFLPIVIICEGLAFLFIVKKTLEVLEKLNIGQRNNSVLMKLTKKYSILLMMVFIFFAGEMIGVCLIAAYARNKIEKDSLLSFILTVLHSVFTSVNIVIAFLQFKKCEKIILCDKVRVLQAITNKCNVEEQNYVLLEMPGLNRVFYVGSKI